MRSLAIAVLVFLSALAAEIMQEFGLPAATFMQETPVVQARVEARKKKQSDKEKKPNRSKQARQRSGTLPPNLGPGIGLGL